MPLFSSRRERRLWGWTLAVVVAIHSTLGLAPRVAGVLRDRGLIGAAFVLGLLLVLATIVTQGLRTRPGGWEICVALGVAAAYLLVLVRTSIPVAERTHLVEYGIVASFVHEALRERASQGRRVRVPGLLAVLATSVLGTLDECLQWILPNREFETRDVLFNVLAGVMAVTTSQALRWTRRRGVRDGPTRGSSDAKV